eukprot:348389-Amphidinium_carterae.1
MLQCQGIQCHFIGTVEVGCGVPTRMGPLQLSCQGPCVERGIASEAGSALWRMWHLDASPERKLYASVVDGETVLWHAETLGSSRPLVLMGHTPHKMRASCLCLNKLPPEVQKDTQIWVYEANDTCGFLGMDEEDGEPLNHHQCSLLQWHGSRGHPVRENELFKQGVSTENFPVLLSPDEELEHLETPEAEGEDLPQEEEEPDWAPTDAERTAIQHAHDMQAIHH